MATYSLTVETTSNATAGGTGTAAAIQMLMAASTEAVLVGVMIKQQYTAAGENSGRWVIDRISAVTTGSSLVPLKMEDTSAASAITDTAKTISTTVAATNTAQDLAVVDLTDGWNDLRHLGIRSGVAKGFALRRATAPTGARVVVATMIWSEV